MRFQITEEGKRACREEGRGSLPGANRVVLMEAVSLVEGRLPEVSGESNL